MFIVWGKKHKYPKVGHAADFCPICRDFREFNVHEIREVSHVYYVSFGKGQLIGYRLDCRECGVRLFEEDADFGGTTPSPSPSIDESIAATNPSLREAYSKRLEIEQDLRSGTLPDDPELRSALLFEPFQALTPEMARGTAETRIDLPSGLGCLGTLVAVAISFVAASFIAEIMTKDAATEDQLIWVVVGVGLLGTIYTLWQLHLSARRWLEKKIVPLLNRALAPLRPTTSEIEDIIAAYKHHGTSFAKSLRIQAFDTIDGGTTPSITTSTKPLTPK